MATLPDRLLPGKPTPLGAHWDGLGANFAVFSAHAERIELCLFDPKGRRELARLPLPECTDEVWHGYLPDARPGLVYGYRAYGPYDPARGHRFNPHKLLLDPYARKIVGPLRWSDALFGYRTHGPRADLSLDRRDSASGMVKAMLIDETFNWGDDHPPAVPWSETVIYEAHCRGLTMRRPEVQKNLRGTCTALAEPWFVEYLQRLGVTTIELMPMHAFIHDRFLVERGLRNYWGYNTLAFFAPEPSYLSAGMTNELRVAIRKLHAAGIEVLLDVVYNHTCEGNELGPTLCWRGLDNASYYRLIPGDERHYVNDTGVGNTLNLSHPRVLQMVMDSLRYWVSSFHVDGFRFDLCATLGREGTGFDPGSGFFDAIRQDPVLARVKLIAEPWDVGPGGYQLGQHPPGFAEWNDRYRDTVRRFWRGDPGQRPELAARLAGSSDLFDHRRRRPWASINFVAAHDGFTLRDTVSYGEKHNEANGDHNADGHADNFSSNWGWEGEVGEPAEPSAATPAADPPPGEAAAPPVAEAAGEASVSAPPAAPPAAPEGGAPPAAAEAPPPRPSPAQAQAIDAVRLRVQRAMLATLLLSHGTPMLLGGDEFGRTQRGNNNAYCQDNDVSWMDWSLADAEPGLGLRRFVAQLIRIRQAHPVLRSDSFLHGRADPAPGVRDIEWFDANGELLSPEAWNEPEGRTLALRRAARDESGAVHIAHMLMNGSADDVRFRLAPPAQAWRLLVDTSATQLPAGADFTGRAVQDEGIEVPAHSVMLLFAAQPTAESAEGSGG